jgi:hypothetical protein
MRWRSHPNCKRSRGLIPASSYSMRADAASFENMDGHEPGKRPYARSLPQTDALADRAARLSKWLTRDSRFVSGNRQLLDEFCARAIEASVLLSRAWLHIRTLHPEFPGVSRVWRRGMQAEARFLDFGFENWPAYLNSPVRHVVEQRKLCRWRLDGAEPLPFPVLKSPSTRQRPAVWALIYRSMTLSSKRMEVG